MRNILDIINRETLGAIANDLIAQSWTIFGLLIGWIVLPDGDTRNFVGGTLLVLTIAWAVTMPLRISKSE